MYCGMAFDRTGDVSPLYSIGAENSLIVWSTHTIEELKKKGGSLRDEQLIAVSYLWELCDNLLLASADNVSDSPGCEGMGLRA